MSHDEMWNEAIERQIPSLLEMLGLDRHANLLRVVIRCRPLRREVGAIVKDALSRKEAQEGPLAHCDLVGPVPHDALGGPKTFLQQVLTDEAATHLRSGWMALRWVNEAFAHPYAAEQHLADATQWAAQCALDLAVHAREMERRAQQAAKAWGPATHGGRP